MFSSFIIIKKTTYVEFNRYVRKMQSLNGHVSKNVLNAISDEVLTKVLTPTFVIKELQFAELFKFALYDDVNEKSKYRRMKSFLYAKRK